MLSEDRPGDDDSYCIYSDDWWQALPDRLCCQPFVPLWVFCIAVRHLTCKGGGCKLGIMMLHEAVDIEVITVGGDRRWILWETF